MKRMKIYDLNELKDIVTPIAISYGLSRVSLFGSYARGEATAESDVDFLVYEKGPVMSLFQLSGLHYDLEKKLGAKVDVITEDYLDDALRSRIEDDEVILYES
jgi:predicted nucleotidyltransferase